MSIGCNGLSRNLKSPTAKVMEDCGVFDRWIHPRLCDFKDKHVVSIGKVAIDYLALKVRIALFDQWRFHCFRWFGCEAESYKFVRNVAEARRAASHNLLQQRR
jgi:hypothetical protein